MFECFEDAVKSTQKASEALKALQASQKTGWGCTSCHHTQASTDKPDTCPKCGGAVTDLYSGKPHGTVIVRPHHRWGQTQEEAKAIAKDWRLAEANAILEEALKPLR